jgi:hypothetical protein
MHHERTILFFQVGNENKKKPFRSGSKSWVLMTINRKNLYFFKNMDIAEQKKLIRVDPDPQHCYILDIANL